MPGRPRSRGSPPSRCRRTPSSAPRIHGALRRRRYAPASRGPARPRLLRGFARRRGLAGYYGSQLRPFGRGGGTPRGVDREAVILPFNDHQAILELLAKLRGKGESPFVVELRREGAKEHVL